MVNPNDPNSESGGIPSSEPGSDPSSAQNADSGPISDELFDSLSELLGDTPTNDEPASLPDLDAWSEEPTEPPSAPEEPGSILGDTTMIQMGPDVETSPLDELSAIGDSVGSADSPDLPLVGEDEGTQPLDAWSETPSDFSSPVLGDVDVPGDLTPEVSDLPDPGLPDIAAETSAESADILSDPFVASSGELPVDLTPEVSDLPDPSLPDIAASTSAESADILSDPFATSSGEPPVDLTPEVSEPSDPSLPDIAASTSAADTVSDPWSEQAAEPQPPIPPLSAGIEEPTLIQPPDVPTISEPVEEPISLESTPDESPLPDPWTDDVEPVAPEELIPEISTPEATDFSGADSPPVTDFAADVSASADIPVVESEIEDLSTPEDQPLIVGEEAPLPDAPLPIGDDLPVADAPLSTDPGTPLDSDATPLTASSGVISSDSDMGEGSTSESDSDPSDPVEPDSPAADIPAVIPPLAGVTGDSAAVPDADGLESVPALESDSEPEDTSAPEPVPAPEPVAVGAASSRSSAGANAGDLGALSDKLPLNRVQAVGLLVAMSTLGTITYFGVTGNQQNPSQTPTSDSSVSSAPLNPNQSADRPSAGDSPLASAPSASEDAPNIGSTGEPGNTPGQVPTNQTAAVPPSPSEAIGGLDTPEVTPSQLDISDVPEDHWAYPFIAKLHAQGIIPDYPDGKFQPDKPVTRAELAAQIQRAFVDEPGQRTLTFSDIESGYWAAEAIEGAVDKKFMSGYPEGDFQPDKLVPRYEVLVALVSGLELEIPASPETSLQRFQDQGQLPDWSKGKIAASTQESIVVSHPEPGLLKPEANATRAEVAAMIYQSLVQSGRLEPIESEYVVTPDS